MVHMTAEGLAAFFRQHPRAKTLDVRFAHERDAGHVPGEHRVQWYMPDGTHNPHFLDEVLERLAPEEYVLVLCRSGEYSHHAASLLEASGFRHVYNLLGGYEDIGEALPVSEPCGNAVFALEI